MIQPSDLLVDGHEYEITFTIPLSSRSKPRRARMGFEGRTRSGQLLFSARGPDRTHSGQYGGTQTFEAKWISAVTEVALDRAKRYTSKPV